MSGHLAILDNRTPFAALHMPMPDGEGGELVLVVLKASFEFSAAGVLGLAAEQTPVRMADETRRPDWRPEEALPGPWRDHDLALFKPEVDVLVDGLAHVPFGEQASEIPVSLRVGDVLSKTVLVTGDRRWDPRGGRNHGEQQSWEPGRPESFSTLPLCWERAYGGTRSRVNEAGEVEVEFETRNPVGLGHGRSLGAPVVGDPARPELPNLEYPEQRLRSPGADVAPAGFGPVGRGWSPRLELAGTFDLDWKDRRWPLRPRDYDPHHEQSAPADQRIQRYRGGEEVELRNMSPAGIWLFRLPHFDVPLRCFYPDRRAAPLSVEAMAVDTIEIEPETRRITLTARARIPVDTRRSPLRDIVLGHPTPGWIRARQTRRRYLDFHGTGGTDMRPCYWS